MDRLLSEGDIQVRDYCLNILCYFLVKLYYSIFAFEHLISLESKVTENW